MVRYRDGEVKNKGFIDDYAFLLWAYLDLYEASFDLSYLQKAKKLTDDMISLFWDEEHGGFYFTGHDAEALIVREKEVYDGCRAFRKQCGSCSAAASRASHRRLITDRKSGNNVFCIQAGHRRVSERPCFLYAKCVKTSDA